MSVAAVVAIVGGVVIWYYDNELRIWVKSKIGQYVDTARQTTVQFVTTVTDEIARKRQPKPKKSDNNKPLT